MYDTILSNKVTMKNDTSPDSWRKPHVSRPFASLYAHDPFGQPGKSSSLVCKTRVQHPMRLLVLLVFLILVAPAAAAENGLYASFRTNNNGHTHGHILGVNQWLGLVILLSQYGVAASGAVVGPLMGTTSVLWLIMRNDAAIDPKLSWM